MLSTQTTCGPAPGPVASARVWRLLVAVRREVGARRGGEVRAGAVGEPAQPGGVRHSGEAG